MNAYFGKPHIWLSKCGAARISLYEKFGTTELWFFYDADGNPSGIRYKNGSTTTDYYFVCNWRGDVIRIYDGAGAVVANYNYDAWGNVISVTDANGAAITDSNHIANVNPLRYRGYYYDSESGLYYLQSRYYDPAVKRFINADGYVSTGTGALGYNMFAYCLNNPVTLSDPTGRSVWIILGIIVLCATVGGVLGYASNEKLIDKPKSSQNSSKNNNQINSNKNYSKEKAGNSNGSVSRNQSRGSKSYDTETPKLSSKDRAMNTFIGATLGMAVGGAAIALVGVGCTLAGVGCLGVTGVRAAAIGCLAFNAEAIIFAPFYGVELEPIDWDYGY